MTIDPRWLTALLLTGVWTTFFSMFNTPGIRGYRNFGLLAGYAIGVASPFWLGWRVALATWAVIGAASGLLYFAHEAVGYLRSRNPDSRPGLKTLFDGLYLWPVMLPEVIENVLADAGILKPAEVLEAASAPVPPSGDSPP